MSVPYKLSPSDFSLLCNVIKAVSRTSGLPASEAEDFSQWVHLTLLERQYAPLSRFEGRSSLQTYLTVVVRRLLLDYLNAQYGKWRPSMWARKTGGLAPVLDRLLTRDGHTVDEAIDAISSRPDAPDSTTLRELAEQVLAQSRRRVTKVVHGSEMSAFQDPIEFEQEKAADERLLRSVRVAYRQLAPADRSLLQMRFGQNLKVVAIARRLDVPARQLYRRLDKIVARLRSSVTGTQTPNTDGSSRLARAASRRPAVETEWSQPA